MNHHETQSGPTMAQLFVSGRVQGVGFRNFSFRCATGLQLLGTVQNLSDGRVTLVVEGEKLKIETLIDALRQGPERAEVSDVAVTWQCPSPQVSDFSIVY